MTTAPAFVFAGGGTGGHLYPGLAIAEQIRAAEPESTCTFVCSDRPLDAELLTAAGAEFTALAAKPMAVRPRGLMRFATAWGPSIRAVRAVIRGYKAEGRTVRVIAMGGFVAAPAVQAARAERVGVTLVNLDAVPGLANRWIARRADDIVTALKVPGRAWPVVGPIVRTDAVPSAAPESCRQQLGLDPSLLTLLVTGGSQGASSINRLLAAFAQARPDALVGWQVIHQTGGHGDDGVAEAYAKAGVRAMVQPYLDEMGLCWGAASLAVCRCGAGTVFEAWASHTPSLMLPYPYHRDQHQRLNAAGLAEVGGVVVAADKIDADANLADHADALAGLLTDSGRRAAMTTALESLGAADGAKVVAARLLGEASSRSRTG